MPVEMPVQLLKLRLPLAMAGALLILAAIVLGASYWVSLKVWPETTCKRCSGGGRNAGSTSKRFGRCKSCAGTGRKPRLGTRLNDRRKS